MSTALAPSVIDESLTFKRDKTAELQEVADDLTVANAKLKKEAEALRYTITSLKFRITELERDRINLLGGEGVNTFKQLASNLEFEHTENRRLRSVIHQILSDIPEGMKD
jgi:hypothetical protein